MNISTAPTTARYNRPYSNTLFKTATEKLAASQAPVKSLIAALEIELQKNMDIGDFVLGKAVQQFEYKFAAYIGKKYWEKSGTSAARITALQSAGRRAFRGASGLCFEIII